MSIHNLPIIFAPVDTDLARAFEALFQPEPNSGCWIWTGNTFKARGGYGCFTCRPCGIRSERAHRRAWELYRGPIPDGAHVLHRCDTPTCVNPDHLFLGDQAANMADKAAKGRQNRGETHGMRKLSEEQARAIIADRRLYREVAEEMGVSIQTVSDIKRGRSWPHLPR